MIKMDCTWNMSSVPTVLAEIVSLKVSLAKQLLNSLAVPGRPAGHGPVPAAAGSLPAARLGHANSCWAEQLFAMLAALQETV